MNGNKAKYGVVAILMIGSLVKQLSILKNSLGTVGTRLEVSPLNDQSLFWDSTVERPWLSSPLMKERLPPAMLLLTNYGWNHPDREYARTVYRGVRAKQLVEGIVNHPWFHPTGWQDFLDRRLPLDNNTHYYVFLDQDTCMEKNYPGYNHGIEGFNKDQGHVQNYHKQRMEQIIGSELLSFPTSRYVLFECSGGGPKPFFHNNRLASKNSSKLVWVSLSSHESQLQPQDFGLPPPPCKPCHLSETIRQDIQTCKAESNRNILLSFLGNIHRKRARKDLAKLHNGNDVIIEKGALDKDPTPLLRSSVFGAAPRGDNLFSYRFSEVLSCGAIPVVYADGWVLPFRLEEWREAAVIMDEANASSTVEVLKQISLEQRCRMRKKGMEIYDKYMKDGVAVIRGVVDRLEMETQGIQALNERK